MKTITALLGSKSFWGLVVLFGGYVSNLHFKFAENWNPDLVAFLLALWSWFMMYARQSAAKMGNTIPMPKFLGGAGAVLLALMLFATTAKAQSQWSGQFYTNDFKHFQPTVNYDIHKFHQLFGIKWLNPNLVGFVGVDDTLLGGLAAQLSGPLTQEAEWTFGPAVRVQDKRATGFGLEVGVKVNF